MPALTRCIRVLAFLPILAFGKTLVLGEIHIDFEEFTPGLKETTFLSDQGIKDMIMEGPPVPGGPQILMLQQKRYHPSMYKTCCQPAAATISWLAISHPTTHLAAPPDTHSLTLLFDPPLVRFEFSRIGVTAFSSVPKWSAEFFNSDGDSLGVIRELFFQFNIPAKFFSFAAHPGDSIARVKIESTNNHNPGGSTWSTFNSVPLDDFRLFPVENRPTHVSQIGFSDSLDGDRDITDFFPDETLHIFVQNTDLIADANNARVQVDLHQGPLHIHEILTFDEPQRAFVNQIPLGPFQKGEVRVFVVAHDDQDTVQIVHKSKVFIKPFFVDIPISSSSGDVEEFVDTGLIFPDSTDLELAEEPLRGRQIVGLRFPAVPIPRNAAIQNTYIQFTADEPGTEDTLIKIEGEADSNALVFTDQLENVSSRQRTHASVFWEIPPWRRSGLRTSKQRSPDISEVIQEIIGHSGWSENSALVLIISGIGRRTAYSWDGQPSQAPVLHIEYLP